MTERQQSNTGLAQSPELFLSRLMQPRCGSMKDVGMPSCPTGSGSTTEHLRSGVPTLSPPISVVLLPLPVAVVTAISTMVAA
jgi:hypothetical protein